MLRLIPALTILVCLAGCFATEISADRPDATALKAKFYPGGSTLDDLIIIDGVNYFGTAQYQMDDPIGDIGFRFESGRRVIAECKEVGKDIIGNDECKQYEVYRSDFDLIPVGTIAAKPEMY